MGQTAEMTATKSERKAREAYDRINRQSRAMQRRITELRDTDPSTAMYQILLDTITDQAKSIALYSADERLSSEDY